MNLKWSRILRACDKDLIFLPSIRYLAIDNTKDFVSTLERYNRLFR